MTDWYAVAGIILGILGIGATIFISLTVYNKQKKDGQKLQTVVDSISLLTEKKEKAEQANKTFECQRIIGHLQEIHDAEQGLKMFLDNYKVGDASKENLRLIWGMSLDGLASKSIWGMDGAIKQLQGKLNDNSLRLDFIKYLGAFYILPRNILKHNMPQQGQDHQRDYLLQFIDEQKAKIQEFIDRFNKEMKKP